MTTRKRIMIVDDTPLMRVIIKKMIDANADLEVVSVAKNGKEALNALATAKPDLILTDIEMPVMDGLTFLKHARLRTRAKIVVLSSIAQAGSKAAAMARSLGADGVVAKPQGTLSLGKERSDTVVRIVREQLGLAMAS